MIIAIGAGWRSPTPCAARSPAALGARAAALGMLAALVAIAGGRDLPRVPRRRSAAAIIGFAPEATAAGEYLRRFGEHYARYVIAEDWPEYTLAYLSYNGGGTPLENHYVLGRRLGGHRGPHQPLRAQGPGLRHRPASGAGREALERLERLFAEHRSRADHRRASGRRADRHGADRRAAGARPTPACGRTPPARWRVGGDGAAAAVRCFAPVGDDHGVSAPPAAHAAGARRRRGRSAR